MSDPQGAEQGTRPSVWHYEAPPVSKRRKVVYNHCKSLLYETLYRGVTRHSLKDIYFLVKLLPRSTVIDSYAMFRYIMILINSVDADRINKNFVLYLETSLSRFDLSKPDVFVEFLTYLVKNERIEDARELFNSRHKYISYHIHRPIPFNDVNVACYGLLLNYIEWQRRTDSRLIDATFDVSIQGWLVNGMDPLKQVEHNYEFFIMCIANVLRFYGFHRKTYLLVSEFQRNNPDNIAGHLLLYKLIKKLTADEVPLRRRANADIDDDEDNRNEHRFIELSAINNFSSDENHLSFETNLYPIDSDKRNILDNLIRLDPRRREILELSTTYQSKIETIQVVMDSLMEVPIIGDATRWRCLQDLLDEVISSNDPDLVDSMACLWQTRYQAYWRLEDFQRVLKDGSENSRVGHINMVKRVTRILRSKFDRELILEPDSSSDESFPDF